MHIVLYCDAPNSSTLKLETMGSFCFFKPNFNQKLKVTGGRSGKRKGQQAFCGRNESVSQ